MGFEYLTDSGRNTAIGFLAGTFSIAVIAIGVTTSNITTSIQKTERQTSCFSLLNNQGFSAEKTAIYSDNNGTTECYAEDLANTAERHANELKEKYIKAAQYCFDQLNYEHNFKSGDQAIWNFDGETYTCELRTADNTPD